jgi:hypothetical protein
VQLALPDHGGPPNARRSYMYPRGSGLRLAHPMGEQEAGRKRWMMVPCCASACIGHRLSSCRSREAVSKTMDTTAEATSARSRSSGSRFGHRHRRTHRFRLIRPGALRLSNMTRNAYFYSIF